MSSFAWRRPRVERGHVQGQEMLCVALHVQGFALLCCSSVNSFFHKVKWTLDASFGLQRLVDGHNGNSCSVQRYEFIPVSPPSSRVELLFE